MKRDAASERSSWKRRLAFVVAALGVAALSSLVALAIGEVVVRLVAPQQLIQVRPDLWQPAHGVGYLHRPNVSVPMNTGERAVTVRTDADGYRIGREGRKEAATRVLLLGDSFMEALQVEYEQSTAALLERGLERALARPVAVRNAGIDGWDPNHYLIRTRALLARDTFALVVVAVFVGNDVIGKAVDHIRAREPIPVQRFRLPRALSKGELIGALLAPFNDALERHSHLYVLLRRQASVLLMRLGLTVLYFPPDYLRAEGGHPRWQLTADRIKALEEEAAAHGTPTLIVLIPESFQVYSQDFDRYVRGFGVDTASVDLDQPTRILSDAIRARGLTVVDPLAEFRAAAVTSPPLFGRIDSHLSPSGHALLAEHLVPTAAALIRR
jgi:SGNH hydrolase-like domain, acetyltransferase AlgX